MGEGRECGEGGGISGLERETLREGGTDAEKGPITFPLFFH